MATAAAEAVAAVEVPLAAAAAAAPGAQQEAAGPAGAQQQQQQAADFDSSRYTLHSQGAEAVSAGEAGAGWPGLQ